MGGMFHGAPSFNGDIARGTPRASRRCWGCSTPPRPSTRTSAGAWTTTWTWTKRSGTKCALAMCGVAVRMRQAPALRTSRPRLPTLERGRSAQQRPHRRPSTELSTTAETAIHAWLADKTADPRPRPLTRTSPAHLHLARHRGVTDMSICFATLRQPYGCSTAAASFNVAGRGTSAGAWTASPATDFSRVAHARTAVSQTRAPASCDGLMDDTLHLGRHRRWDTSGVTTWTARRLPRYLTRTSMRVGHLRRHNDGLHVRQYAYAFDQDLGWWRGRRARPVLGVRRPKARPDVVRRRELTRASPASLAPTTPVLGGTPTAESVATFTWDTSGVTDMFGCFVRGRIGWTTNDDEP